MAQSIVEERPSEIWAVIPAYRAQASIVGVVTKALKYVDHVVVIDDACPQGSGQLVEAAFRYDSRVRVIAHAQNRGVGGATKTGFQAALDGGAALIVKLDADDQMDPCYVAPLAKLFERYPYIGFAKGNRFASRSVLSRMPLVRLVGNSGLSFLVKACSGYWNLVDPTNGYIMCRAEILREFRFERLADRYFFEIDLLCALGLRRISIAELQMDAIYDGENSSLSVERALVGFPPALAVRYIRRLLVQYVVEDINVATFYAFIGFPLVLGGIAFGAYEWMLSSETHLPRTSGTVILALLLFIVGFQLLLQATAFDVSAGTRTLKARVRRDRDEVATAEHEPSPTFVDI